jgi:hypothetical protein
MEGTVHQQLAWYHTHGIIGCGIATVTVEHAKYGHVSALISDQYCILTMAASGAATTSSGAATTTATTATGAATATADDTPIDAVVGTGSAGGTGTGTAGGSVSSMGKLPLRSTLHGI